MTKLTPAGYNQGRLNMVHARKDDNFRSRNPRSLDFVCALRYS